MNLLKKTPHFLFSLRLQKVRKAYGVRSTTKFNRTKHYLFFDCDTNYDFNYFIDHYTEPVLAYPTPHGHHVIVFKAVPFPEAVMELLSCPFTDRNWVAIAVKRGYFFLETSCPIFSNLLSYMRIERT